MSLSRITIAGVPLAGKMSALVSMAAAAGADVARSISEVPDGRWKGAQESALHFSLDRGEDRVSVRTIPGGAAVESTLMLLEKSDIGVFLFDFAGKRREQESEFWRKVSGAVPPERWVYLINESSDSKETAEDVVAAVHANPALPRLSACAIDAGHGPRMLEFILEALDRNR
ncbi:MAG TPA: hypothetical protein VF443_10040 [Nitrospira sp.]